MESAQATPLEVILLAYESEQREKAKREADDAIQEEQRKLAQLLPDFKNTLWAKVGADLAGNLLENATFQLEYGSSVVAKVKVFGEDFDLQDGLIYSGSREYSIRFSDRDELIRGLLTFRRWLKGRSDFQSRQEERIAKPYWRVVCAVAVDDALHSTLNTLEEEGYSACKFIPMQGETGETVTVMIIARKAGA